MLARIAHSSLLARLTVLVAVSHVVMAVLHATGRAAPHIAPPGLHPPVSWVDDRWWIGVHVAAAALLVAAAATGTITAALVGCSLSATTWATWAGLDIAWSLGTRPAVSLVAGAVGVAVMAPLAAVCGLAWSERD